LLLEGEDRRLGLVVGFCLRLHILNSTGSFKLDRREKGATEVCVSSMDLAISNLFYGNMSLTVPWSSRIRTSKTSVAFVHVSSLSLGWATLLFTQSLGHIVLWQEDSLKFSGRWIGYSSVHSKFGAHCSLPGMLNSGAPQFLRCAPNDLIDCLGRAPKGGACRFVEFSQRSY
jgi:hypothetical protein